MCISCNVQSKQSSWFPSVLSLPVSFKSYGKGWRGRKTVCFQIKQNEKKLLSKVFWKSVICSQSSITWWAKKNQKQIHSIKPKFLQIILWNITRNIFRTQWMASLYHLAAKVLKLSAQYKQTQAREKSPFENVFPSMWDRPVCLEMLSRLIRKIISSEQKKTGERSLSARDTLISPSSVSRAASIHQSHSPMQSLEDIWS